MEYIVGTNHVKGLNSHLTQPDWFLGCYTWIVRVVKDVIRVDISAFQVLLLAAMAFATNGMYILDEVYSLSLEARKPTLSSRFIATLILSKLFQLGETNEKAILF